MRHRLLAIAVATTVAALAGCGGGNDTATAASGDASAPAAGADARPDREWTDEARVDAIAATLQACSYEGNKVTVQAGQLRGPAPADCRQMVDRIMGYTGLPANFLVTAGPVPNALAVILLDQAKVPQRVIAFNPDFIGATRQMTGGDDWAPVSIMAHEIGHHLSGHTITAGGSRPSIELEADKFSGFVLYRMGAQLADATKAMEKIGSDVEQATHPAKARRVAAISEGWKEACRQGGGTACDAGQALKPAQADVPAPVPASAPLPAPSPQSTPFKAGRFLADEANALQPADATRIGEALQALVRERGIEFALLVTDDLHGMTPEQYAWAMMRQLRIGQLDLGNGGVLVVSPGQKKAAAAYAPGIARILEFSSFPANIEKFMANDPCKDPAACARSRSSAITIPFDSLLGQLQRTNTRFELRFEDIASVIAAADANRAARKAARDAGKAWEDLPDDRMLGQLVRFTGKVTDLAPKPEQLRVNAGVVKDGRWKAVLVESGGREVTLYMQPQTEGLMPAGKLESGREYTFTGELHSSGQFHTDGGVVQGNVQLRLFSYEAL